MAILLAPMPKILKSDGLRVKAADLLSAGGEDALIVRSLYGKILEHIFALRERASGDQQCESLIILIRCWLISNQ